MAGSTVNTSWPCSAFSVVPREIFCKLLRRAASAIASPRRLKIPSACSASSKTCDAQEV
jgi:hypothetical protein